MTVNDAGTLLSDVTDDAFLGGALRLLQPRDGYRAGLDAVLLAAAVGLPPGAAAHVLDIGAGIGTVGLCLARRLPDAQVVLLEREPGHAELARKNILRNALEDRVRVAEAAVGAPEADLLSAGLTAESFDVVLANPPFHDRDSGTRSAAPLKDGAHAMAGGDLEAWARFMARMARPGGVMTLIHKASSLAAILGVLQGRFGAIGVVPVHAREAEPAIRVIVRAVKGSRSPLSVDPAVVLHGPDGRFRPEIEAVLRAGAALKLD